MTDLAFAAAGFAVGTVVGLTGVGGGSLMTPLLIFGFGVQAPLAVGTDLLFAALTKLGGCLGLARARAIDWALVARLAGGSVPAALLTLLALRQLGPQNPDVQHIMTTALGAALVLTAFASLYRVLRPARLDARREAAAHKTAPVWRSVALGAAMGVLVTLTSVGAGAIGVLVLMLLYPHLGLPRLVAADIAHAVPLTLVAGLGHASMGSVDVHMLLWLLAGSLPGIWLGTHWMLRVPERWLRAALSPLLAYAGLKLIAL